MRRPIFLVSAVVLFLVLGLSALAIAWLDGRILAFPKPGSLIVESATPNRTGANCSDADCLAKFAPIAAFAEYRRCGGYSEGARVGESRLACSAGWITDQKERGVEGHSLYRQFRRACRTHDLCYGHASATYDPATDGQRTRARCDYMFLADIVRDCAHFSGVDANKYRWCKWRGMAAYGAVWKWGRNLLEKEPAACDYEPGPHAPRDQVVSGRFVENGPDHVVTLVQDKGLKSLTIDLLALANDDAGTVTTRARLEKLSPAEVVVADRELACQRLRDADGQLGEGCPKTLEKTLVSAEDWLRFPAIVLDSDGDGVDEIILVTLTRDFGLGFTHLRVESTPQGIAFAAPMAYLAVHRPKNYQPPSAGADDLSARDCEKELEFSDCDTRRASNPVPILSDERATQLLSHNFVVVQSPPDNCAPLIESGPEEIVMLGGYGYDLATVGHRLHRFYFDAVSKRWVMRRDKFTNDGHRMRYCDTEEKGTFRQVSRLQIPSLAVRGPVKCRRRGEQSAITVDREAVSTIVREKCPSSYIRARAGELNDIDLVSYPIDPSYAETDDDDGRKDEPKIAQTSWLPLIWNEAADPVMTSRAARRARLIMVGAYAGGTRKIVPSWLGLRSQVSSRSSALQDDRSYPLITVLSSDDRLGRAPKVGWMERQPDTVGLAPIQYAVIHSNQSASRQAWSRRLSGDPRMFFDLPSVLAPFDIYGKPGLSVVLFANRTTFKRRLPPDAQTDDGKAALRPRTVQILIVPLPEGGSGVTPSLIECRVPSAADDPEAPIRPSWQDDFLHREPVLPGLFFTDAQGKRHGGLAIAWRTRKGGLALTPLRYGSRLWWLGSQPCSTLSPIKSGQNNLWMMRLN